MSPLEAGLREIIAAVVREEIGRALAELRAPDEYLSTRAAAEVAGVAVGTIRRWIREGKLDEQRAGRMVRVRRDDLDRLLRDGGRKQVAVSPEQLARRMFGS